MNAAEERIRERLAGVPSEFAPLADAAERYLRYCSAVDTDGTAMIGHMPWKAPFAYAFRLYPSTDKRWFAKYAKLNRLDVPSRLRPLLGAMNGCFAFGFSLYGMPLSMVEDAPSFDRSRLQCQDLSQANTYWKHDFQAGPQAFHFGSRDCSRTEFVGYFLQGSDIVSLQQGGRVVGRWSDFTSFLADELRASEERACSDIPADWWH